MAIIRANLPETNYTVVSNAVIRDNRLSFRARGILLALLSRPADWRTNADALARESIEGRTAILTALTELEQQGYLVRIKKQDELGRWTTDSLVYDQPKSGFPTSDNPTAGNPPLLEIPSTKYGQEEQPVVIVVNAKLAAGEVENILTKLNAARATGVNAWSLSKMVGAAYDTLDESGNTKAVIELVCWYLQEMLGRPLRKNEYGRTGQILKRFGRIGFEALDFAVTKALDDPWAYAFKTAQGMYREAKG